MKALGIESDEKIVNYITNDKNDIIMLDKLRKSLLFASKETFKTIDENGIEIDTVVKSSDDALKYLGSRLRDYRRFNINRVNNIESKDY